jgi:catechol 2,3-dioxygenase-like lactoylglutathione lyase family enzyme
MANLRRPMTALRVRNLETSVGFYVQQIGCELVHRSGDGQVATIEHQGYLLLLAGPDAADLTPYLSSTHEILKPCGTVFFNGGTSDRINDLHTELRSRGVCDLTLVERWWGDHTLATSDPDGYRVCFWTSAQRTPAEVLDLYEAGAPALERALEGLSAAALDRSLEQGEWTIRQIVHHLADSEATVLGRTKMALAEPGRMFAPNPYLQDTWADGLDYAGRDIAPAVALFGAIRVHMTQLMRHLPDAWERSTVSPEGHEMTAGTMIGMLMSHAFEHIEDIERIRACSDEGMGHGG